MHFLALLVSEQALHPLQAVPGPAHSLPPMQSILNQSATTRFKVYCASPQFCRLFWTVENFRLSRKSSNQQNDSWDSCGWGRGWVLSGVLSGVLGVVLSSWQQWKAPKESVQRRKKTKEGHNSLPGSGSGQPSKQVVSKKESRYIPMHLETHDECKPVTCTL